MKKISIGDIFEIETDRGLSYGQLTHRHPTHTDVLRIFEKKFKKRPTDFSFLEDGEIEYTVLCAVGAGYRSGILPRVGNASVRNDLQEFPKFRIGNASPQEPNDDKWSIWDGESEKEVKNLSEEQRKLPRMAIRNFASIRKMIEGKIHSSLL